LSQEDRRGRQNGPSAQSQNNMGNNTEQSPQDTKAAAMEQAIALSALLQGGQADREALEQSAQKAMEMMEWVKMLQTMQQMSKPPEPPTGGGTAAHQAQQTQPQPEPPSAQAFAFYDDPIQTPALKAIKAAIPYVEHPYQKPLGLYVKMIEIQKLMEMYSQTAIHMQSAATGGDWRRGMLNAIRPHMPGEKQTQIDFLLTALTLQDILKKMQEVQKTQKM